MKNKLLWMLILLAQNFYAQEITGSWYGELDLNGMKLPLVLQIKKENHQYTSTAKSPKQSEKDIPVNKTEFINNELTFEIAGLDVSYTGKFITDHFEGNFKQRNFSVPLHLYRNKTEEAKIPVDLTVKDIGERKINTKKIDDYLNYIAKNSQGIGSISIFRNGAEIYKKNFGQEQLSHVKWDSKTGYQIGSISKLITAVMLMQLVEKGKLNLNDPLSKYYPDLPNAGIITLKSMMNHTSGLGDYAGAWLFRKPVGDQAILDTIKKHGVEFQPGEKTRYSNSGYYLLSRILEKVSGKLYHVLLKENITSKAHMNNTFSVLDTPENIFRSYENINGEWTEIEDFDFHNCIGLGDITSTPHDMNLFINALFSNRFIKKQTLEMMMPASSKSFGLGLMAVPFYNKVYFGHGGDTAGTHSIVSFSPTEKYAVAIMINGEKMPHNNISIGVLSIMYDQNYEFPKFTEIQRQSANELQKYTGNYHARDIPLDFTIFMKDENLFAQLTDQPAFPLAHTEGNKFKYDKAGVEIIFSPESKELTLIQNGSQLVFDKK